VLLLALGIICLVWPSITLGAIVILFAVLCFADAINQVFSMMARESAAQRIWQLLILVFDVAAGVVALVWPDITILALVLVVGVWAVIIGIVECVIAYQLRGAAPGTGWLAVAGGLAIVAGILLLAWPDRGAYTLAVLFGILLVLRGVMWLALAAGIGGVSRAVHP